jgi:hypothetical protein
VGFVAEGNGDVFTGFGPAPDPDRFIALKDHAGLEEMVEAQALGDGRHIDAVFALDEFFRGLSMRDACESYPSSDEDAE